MSATCAWNTGEVLCHNYINKVPRSVTVKFPKVATTKHSIPVTNIHERPLKEEVGNKMAVCTSTVSHLTARDRGFLLQSFHMKFEMGANKIFIYGGYQNSPEIDELLSQLTGPSVQMIDWVVPEVIRNRTCARPLQYLDCQYRNMYLYKYLAVIDLDEFVYPMATGMNTVAMLDDMSKRNLNQAASFLFYHYQSCYGNETSEGLQLRRWGQRSTLHVSIWGPTYTFKCIHRPELVTYIGFPKFVELLYDTWPVVVSPYEGNVYYFHRPCAATESKPIENQPVEMRQRDDVIMMHLNRTRKYLASNEKPF